MTAAPAARPFGTPPAEQSAKRRQIIEGARALFLAQGFDAASMCEPLRYVPFGGGNPNPTD